MFRHEQELKMLGLQKACSNGRVQPKIGNLKVNLTDLVYIEYKKKRKF